MQLFCQFAPLQRSAAEATVCLGRVVGPFLYNNKQTYPSSLSDNDYSQEENIQDIRQSS